MKAQLQFGLREFPPTDLQDLLEQFTAIGDGVGVIRVVRAARARRTVLTIGNPLLPLERIPAVIFYLAAMRSDELSPFLARLGRHENDFEVETAIGAVTFREFMTDTSPIRKAALRRIGQIWDRFNVSESVARQLLFDFPIQKLSLSAEKPRKLAVVVAFIGVPLSLVKSIPTAFPNPLLLNLHLFCRVLPPAVLAQTLLALAERCAGTRAAEDFLSFSDGFASTCDAASPEHAMYLRIRALLPGPQKPPARAVLAFLESHVPSLFLPGFRLISDLFFALSDGPRASFLRSGLEAALATFPRFCAMRGVADTLSLSVTPCSCGRVCAPSRHW
jgi:hypothetical protein